MTNTEAPTVPEGYRLVTEAEFFAALKACKRDIMPTTEDPRRSVWRDQWGREVWGLSYPGWKFPGEPEAYMLRM